MEIRAREHLRVERAREVIAVRPDHLRLHHPVQHRVDLVERLCDRGDREHDERGDQDRRGKPCVTVHGAFTPAVQRPSSPSCPNYSRGEQRHAQRQDHHRRHAQPGVQWSRGAAHAGVVWTRRRGRALDGRREGAVHGDAWFAAAILGGARRARGRRGVAQPLYEIDTMLNWVMKAKVIWANGDHLTGALDPQVFARPDLHPQSHLEYPLGDECASARLALDGCG